MSSCSKRSKWVWAVTTAVLPFAVQAQVDLTSLDRDMAGPKSRVMVLGTVHLRGMPASFNPSSLDGLLDKLAAYKPDIITIEHEPPEECDQAARQAAKYGPDYCASTEAARTATGLDIPGALTEIDKTLKAWPAQATPAQRRKLSALFMASSDRASAYVQWLQLPQSERHAGDTLSAPLVDTLEKLARRNDESYLIAARLAARLGQQRVYPVDNHTGDYLELSDKKAFLASIEAAWASSSGELKEGQKQEKALADAGDMLGLYRYINTPEHSRIDAEANVRGPMLAKSAEHYPQMWVAGWEIRNMRMVANIRETFRQQPGARVLTVVGAAHKPWFDSWLGQLQGIEIVNVADVLK